MIEDVRRGGDAKLEAHRLLSFNHRRALPSINHFRLADRSFSGRGKRSQIGQLLESVMGTFFELGEKLQRVRSHGM